MAACRSIAFTSDAMDESMYPKTSAPTMKDTMQKVRSALLVGMMSPYPTVVRVVSAQYSAYRY